LGKQLADGRGNIIGGNLQFFKENQEKASSNCLEKEEPTKGFPSYLSDGTGSRRSHRGRRQGRVYSAVLELGQKKRDYQERPFGERE